MRPKNAKKRPNRIRGHKESQKGRLLRNIIIPKNGELLPTPKKKKWSISSQHDPSGWVDGDHAPSTCQLERKESKIQGAEKRGKGGWMVGGMMCKKRRDSPGPRFEKKKGGWAF